MPKFSVSVPDDLWSRVHPSGASVSETVQRGLRALESERRAALGPMANAPDQPGVERYRPAFDTAVAGLARQISEVRDAGYRFGMWLAPAMAISDFDVLDDERTAVEQLRGMLVAAWDSPSAPLSDDELVISVALFGRCATAAELLRACWKQGASAPEDAAFIAVVLGSPDAEAAGVRWGEGDEEYPVMSELFASAVAAALRDVRDEALRRVAGAQPDAYLQ